MEKQWLGSTEERIGSPPMFKSTAINISTLGLFLVVGTSPFMGMKVLIEKPSKASFPEKALIQLSQKKNFFSLGALDPSGIQCFQFSFESKRNGLIKLKDPKTSFPCLEAKLDSESIALNGLGKPNKILILMKELYFQGDHPVG